MTTSQTKPKSTTWIWVVGILGVLAVVFVPVSYFGATGVKGVEFNPSTWQVRHFEFRADPFTNAQWTGIERDTTRTTIDNSILAHLNTVSIPNADRWDLVELDDYHKSKSLGPAAVLVDLLTTQTFGWSNGATTAAYWKQWTADHPRLAPAFWQAAQVLTIHNCYAAIPELFDLTVVADDQFDANLERVMSQALLQKAKLQRDRGDTELAARTAAAGLKYASDNLELKELSRAQQESHRDEH